jgi:hypothetical protein
MNNFEYKNLTPFKWFVLENFPFIEADFDALTEWQLFCKLGKEMNKIIKSVNDSGEQVEKLTDAFISLQEYVENYFKNLDVQDEINNKLNEMSASGELQDIINQYLQLAGIFTYNNINEMKSAINLTENSKCCVFGNKEINDGGFNFYNVKNSTSLDVDGKIVVKLNNNKYAIAVNQSIFQDTNITYNTFRLKNTRCYIVDIPKTNKYGQINKFKIGLPFNDFEVTSRYQSTNDFSKLNNTTLALNSGVFDPDSDTIWGATIIDGQIVRNNKTTGVEDLYYLTIADDGKFGYVKVGNTTAEQMIADGIKNAVMGFFPILVNGEKVSHTYPYVDGTHPRQVLCQLKDGTQFVFACEGIEFNNVGLDFVDIQDYLLENYPNIDLAFNMDGGGSLSVNYYRNKLNKNLDDGGRTDRKVPAFLYINNENSVNSIQNDMNKILNVLSTKINDLQTQLNALDKLTQNGLIFAGTTEYQTLDFYNNGVYDKRIASIQATFNSLDINLSDSSRNNFKNCFHVDQDNAKIPIGVIGSYVNTLLPVSDCNDTTLRNGFFRTYSETVNKPNFGNYVLLNLKFSEDPSEYGINQYCFPNSNNNSIFKRRYDGGNWSAWTSITPINNSANRDEAKYLGQVYFDTTLNKPIWYNGTNWVDANGNVV